MEIWRLATCGHGLQCSSYNYRSCLHSCVLHGSETWPVEKENELTLYWAEMEMIRWICGEVTKVHMY